MKDEANLQTEKEIYKLERRLKKVYREASEDIQKEMDVFLAKFKKQDAIWKDQIKKGIKTEEEYKEWLKEKIFIGERWKAKQESLANTMFNANQAAANMVNQAMPEVFQINANYTAFNLEKQAGVDFGFDIYNSGAVKQLLQEDSKILPFKKIKKSKDMRWNFRNIKNEVAKGIITGQSADDIADRLAKVIPNRNHKQLLTHARTMVTSAQNQGRMTRLQEAKNEKGINVKKKWLATLDMRTRFSHARLDGQVKDIDEPFIADGYELMEPGDPTAAPSLVYNCRCRLEEVLVDFPDDEYTKRRDNETGELIEDMDYKTWYKMKTGKELGPDNTPLKKTQNKPPKARKVKETPAAEPKENIKDSLMKAYENHRLSNKLTSTPAEEVKDIFRVSLPKMNEDSKKALAEQLSSLISRYDSTVRTIRQMDKMEYVGHINSFATTYHDYETDYSEIMLNPAKYGDVERIKELIKKGYSPKIKEEYADRYVITHEFAHTLIDMETELNSKRNWVNADYKKIKEARKEIKSVYDKYVREVGELEKEKKKVELEAMTSMDEASWKKASDLSSELQKKSVSKYALTNSDEFMAECFAHNELGGPQNNYVDEMMQILNKYFGRK